MGLRRRKARKDEWRVTLPPPRPVPATDDVAQALAMGDLAVDSDRFFGMTVSLRVLRTLMIATTVLSLLMHLALTLQISIVLHRFWPIRDWHSFFALPLQERISMGVAGLLPLALVLLLLSTPLLFIPRGWSRFRSRHYASALMLVCLPLVLDLLTILSFILPFLFRLPV